MRTVKAVRDRFAAFAVPIRCPATILRANTMNPGYFRLTRHADGYIFLLLSRIRRSDMEQAVRNAERYLNARLAEGNRRTGLHRNITSVYKNNLKIIRERPQDYYIIGNATSSYLLSASRFFWGRPSLLKAYRMRCGVRSGLGCC
jgi:hypothetical protein